MSMLVYEGKVEIIKPVRKMHEEGWNSDLEIDGGAADEDEVDRIKAERSKAGKKRARNGFMGSDPIEQDGGDDVKRESGSESDEDEEDDNRTVKKRKTKDKEERTSSKERRKREKEK